MTDMNLSEKGLWSLMNQNLRNRFDEFIIAELNGSGSSKDRQEYFDKLAVDIARLYTIRRHKTADGEPSVGAVSLLYLSDILPKYKWEEFVKTVRYAVSGLYCLRKADILCARYGESDDLPMMSADEKQEEGNA